MTFDLSVGRNTESESSIFNQFLMFPEHYWVLVILANRTKFTAIYINQRDSYA